MPYRRIPTTDLARIRAIKIILEQNEGYNAVVSLKLLSDLRSFLPRFESAHAYYKQCLENQVATGRKLKHYVRNARLYVSHFIQVLNLCVVRSEIKVEQKDLYGLPRDSHTIPDISTDSALLEWGNRIIKGERERLRRGGIPIYNPTIAKVAVHYDIFKDEYESHKSLQLITLRSLEKLGALRGQADRLIVDAWNQVESHFKELAGNERFSQCRAYGITYYYRAGEQKIIDDGTD